MNPREAQFLLDQTKVKSTLFAAILGFFFPALAAFYVDKPIVGLICFVIDLFNLVLVWVVGLGPLTVLFRVCAALLAYLTAKTSNHHRALAQLVTSREQVVPFAVRARLYERQSSLRNAA